MTRQRLLLLSPFVVIALGHLTARVAVGYVGAWAWVPLTVVFWTTLALLIAAGGGRASVRRWLAPPTGSRGWLLLALLVGCIPLVVLLQNWRLLAPLHVWLPWLLFACINPWLEEGYWRGVLLDAARGWPGWAAVLYTSLVYAASHPLMWGVGSVANREWIVLASTFVMGVAWAVIYQRTGSLRWPVLSHVMVDLFNLSVAIFLNLNIRHG